MPEVEFAGAATLPLDYRRDAGPPETELDGIRGLPSGVNLYWWPAYWSPTNVQDRNYRRGGMLAPTGICLHTPYVQDDVYNNAEAVPAYFAQPGIGASTHYYVSRYGHIYQMVREADEAYANGGSGVLPGRSSGSERAWYELNVLNSGWYSAARRANGGAFVRPNQVLISIEIEGIGESPDFLTAGQPFSVSWFLNGARHSVTMRQSVAALLAHISRRHQIPLTADYVVGHEEVDYGRYQNSRATSPGSRVIADPGLERGFPRELLLLMARNVLNRPRENSLGEPITSQVRPDAAISAPPGSAGEQIERSAALVQPPPVQSAGFSGHSSSIVEVAGRSNLAERAVRVTFTERPFTNVRSYERVSLVEADIFGGDPAQGFTNVQRSPTAAQLRALDQYELFHLQVTQQLRVKFDLKYNVESDDKPRLIQIYNLSQETADQLHEFGLNIKLEAGYGNRLETLFDGEVLSVETKWEKSDRITSIVCGERGTVGSGVYNRTWAAVPLRTVLLDLAQAQGLELGQTGHLKPNVDSLVHFSWSGSAKAGLEKLLAIHRLRGSVSYGLLHLTRINPLDYRPESSSDGAFIVPENYPEPPVELNIASGVIGLPAFVRNEEYDRLLGFKAELRLTGAIQPFQYVRMNTPSVRGDYQITTVEYRGDTWAGDWRTTITGRSIPGARLPTGEGAQRRPTFYGGRRATTEAETADAAARRRISYATG